MKLKVDNWPNVTVSVHEYKPYVYFTTSTELGLKTLCSTDYSSQQRAWSDRTEALDSVSVYLSITLKLGDYWTDYWM
mgnify:CR=1 FL=1